jgi:hypothetical protein
MEQEISKTGFWNPETAHIHHIRSIPLENWIVNFLKKINYPQNKRIWDFGCGLGYYLKALREGGFLGGIGIEGNTPKEAVYNSIYSLDLTSNLKFINKGIVICLEVMEHIPATLTERVLNNIDRNCEDMLILSWAVRGQDGFGHVNCLDNHEVISIIEKRGYILMEEETKSARSVIDDTTPWFKNTILIFKKV